MRYRLSGEAFDENAFLFSPFYSTPKSKINPNLIGRHIGSWYTLPARIHSTICDNFLGKSNICSKFVIRVVLSSVKAGGRCSRTCKCTLCSHQLGIYNKMSFQPYYSVENPSLQWMTARNTIEIGVFDMKASFNYIKIMLLTCLINFDEARCVNQCRFRQGSL